MKVILAAAGTLAPAGAAGAQMQGSTGSDTAPGTGGMGSATAESGGSTGMHGGMAAKHGTTAKRSTTRSICAMSPNNGAMGSTSPR